MAQQIKNLPTVQDTQEMGLIPGSGRSPGVGKWHPTPLFFPELSHGQRSLAGYSLWDCKESDMPERLMHTRMINDVGHLFVSLFYVSTSSLAKYPCMSFIDFLITSHISRLHTISMISDHWCWPWSLNWDSVCKFFPCNVILSPSLHILLFERTTLKEWGVIPTSLKEKLLNYVKFFCRRGLSVLPHLFVSVWYYGYLFYTSS